MFQLKTLYFNQSHFYLGRILFITPAFTYTVFFVLIQLLLNKASLQLLFMLYFCHHSSTYLCSSLFN